jgi:hypothetical protein
MQDIERSLRRGSRTDSERGNDTEKNTSPMLNCVPCVDSVCGIRTIHQVHFQDLRTKHERSRGMKFPMIASSINIATNHYDTVQTGHFMKYSITQ